MSRIQFPASPWFVDDHPDADTCCTGTCLQGRNCPMYQQDEPPATRTDLALAAVIVAVIAGFTLAGPLALHFIAQFI